MKKFKGFTLIELIVVIAILGVLAAILVPAMMGWVTRSKIASCNSNASEVYNQVAATITELDTDGIAVDDAVVIYSNGKWSGTDEAEIKQELISSKTTFSHLGDVTWAVSIANGKIEAVVYSENSSCLVVGGYPVQCPSDNTYHFSGKTIDKFLDAASGSGDVKWESFR